MEIERVQHWIASALVLTVATIFAVGIILLAGTAQVQQRAGSKPGLLLVSAAVGIVAMVGVRIINQKPIVTPWLLVGLLPALGGVWWLYFASGG